MDDAVNFLNPRPVPAKMVEQIPFGVDRSMLTGRRTKVVS
jgi:hypothetical protein